MDGLIAYTLSKKYVNEKTSGIATGMSWKGTKEKVSDLPQIGNLTGDLWHVNEDGNEYAWDGSKWEALGSIGSSASIDSALSNTSENPVQNKVINAALQTKGTYSKPSGGIPKTDLASAVQTSLGKADTALQSSDLSSAIDSALAQAKASGEFDGADGAPGAKGDKGDTGPQGPKGDAGSDYVLTYQDKVDIAGLAAQLITPAESEAY